MKFLNKSSSFRRKTHKIQHQQKQAHLQMTKSSDTTAADKIESRHYSHCSYSFARLSFSPTLSLAPYLCLFRNVLPNDLNHKKFNRQSLSVKKSVAICVHTNNCKGGCPNAEEDVKEVGRLSVAL